MFHEKYLRYFLTVCEEKNITAAARKLELAQPALSRIIRELEQEAGLPLLVREAGGVYLTQAGEIYARSARRVLAAYQEGQREIHDIRDSHTGQVRLGLSRISSEVLLPVILEQFRKQYPQMELQLTETWIRELNPLLRQGKLDLSLTYEDTDPELEYQPLLTDPIYLEAPAFFYEKQGNWSYGSTNVLPDVSLLEHMPFILLKPGRGMRFQADSLFREAGLHPRVILETDSVTLSHRLVLANQGFALIPRMALQILRKKNRAVFYQLPAFPLRRTLYLARRRGAYQTRAMEALARLIRSSVTGK
ncbi:LysR family transcriptional regulator [uncultured Acidaminococcus sp.]|uniref:LysR family transcriptional regulator n=1 Tax=uncultured Acidaminococcus sp. TaxID=352152 RepID=UPI0026671DA3|nr:LysR family transcriptional regulator [uncultured Acidaminococcus sp.]